MARKVDTITRADGSTTYQVRFRDPDRISKTTGKPMQSAQSFDTEKEAIQFAKSLDALGSREAVARLFAEEDGHGIPTLNEVAADHIRLLTGIEEGTRLNYSRLWARTWHKHLGHIRADLLTTDDIREAVNILAVDYGTKSLENQRGLLAGVLGRCIEKGWHTRKLTAGVRLPEGKRVAVGAEDADDDAEMVCLTHAEWEALYEAVAEHYRPFVRFLAGTGCRWGEAIVLRPMDLDLDRGIVRIRRALKWSPDGAKVIGPPKTKKSRRTIVLPPEVITDLRQLLDGKRSREYVFTSVRGDMMNHRNFWSHYWTPAIWRAQQCETHRAAHKATGCKCGTTYPKRCAVHKKSGPPAPCGCPGTLGQAPRIHDMRHTHASWLLANGVPIHVVQARLGHESIQTTVDTYSHLMPDAQIAAAAAASQAFGGTLDRAPVLELNALDDDALRRLAGAVLAEIDRRGIEPPDAPLAIGPA